MYHHTMHLLLFEAYESILFICCPQTHICINLHVMINSNVWKSIPFVPNTDAQVLV